MTYRPKTSIRKLYLFNCIHFILLQGTIQKFVDDFLTTILSAKESLPPAVKWLFDLFDEAAARYGISDPEVVHAWKSNRFV